MKLANVQFTAVAYYSNGETKVRFFCSESAMSKWANRQYNIDEDVTIEVYKGSSVDGEKYCTYHA